MLLKVNFVKPKERGLARSLEEIQAEKKALAEEEKYALREHKKNAIKKV